MQNRFRRESGFVLLGDFELIEFLHQARFAARGVILFDDAFRGGFIQRADGLLDGEFRFSYFAGGDQHIRIFDLGARGHPRDAIAHMSACALAHGFDTGVLSSSFLGCVCQFENPPRLFRGAYYINLRFLTNRVSSALTFML